METGQSGSYGTTKIYMEKGRRIVEKTIDEIENDNITFDFVRENAILKYLKPHPNIVEYRGYNKHKIYTYHGGEMLDKHIPIKHRASLITQLIQGVSYLHRSGIAHRDLSPRNVVCQEGHLRIIDFGMARFIGSRGDDTGPILDTMTSRVVCVWNRPPELFVTDSITTYFPFKIDAWSVGTLILAIMGGVPWMKNCDDEGQRHACIHIDCGRIIKHLKGVCKDDWLEFVEPLITGFLNPTPSERLGVIEAEQLLQLSLIDASRPPIRQSPSYPIDMRETRNHYIAKICCYLMASDNHSRTMVLACAIFDTYLSSINTDDTVYWCTVAMACIGLAEKMVDTCVTAIGDTIKWFGMGNHYEKTVIQQEYIIMKVIDNNLICDTIDDHIPHSIVNLPAVHRLKSSVLRLSTTDSVIEMADAVKQVYYAAPVSVLAKELQHMRSNQDMVL